MEFPLDKETMRSFLGIMNYLNWYSALSAHLCASLNALTDQATDYKPSREHFENFNRLKWTVPTWGLFHTSRALTKTEQNYQNLERSTWNHLGNGKVPLFLVWKGIHIGN